MVPPVKALFDSLCAFTGRQTTNPIGNTNNCKSAQHYLASQPDGVPGGISSMNASAACICPSNILNASMAKREVFTKMRRVIVPGIITLAVTILRLIGELRHWPAKLLAESGEVMDK
jgi:hypothetical protein